MINKFYTKFKLLLELTFLFIFCLRPRAKLLLNLIRNQRTNVKFITKKFEIDIQLERSKIHALYLLSRIDRNGFFIHKLFNNKVIFLIDNYKFESKFNADILLYIFKLSIFYNKKRLEIRCENNQSIITFKLNTLHLTLKGPLDYVATCCEMFSDYFHEIYENIDFSKKIVVDIGAFIGDTALLFILKGAKKVYAFEPSEEFFKLASENCSGFNNIELFNLGLGCSEGEYSLAGYSSGKSIVKNINKVGTNNLSALEVVEVKSFNRELMKIIEKEGRIDVLKLDCEGCEWDFINCCNEDIFNYVDTVIVEIHGNKHEAFKKKMKLYGYKLVKQAKVHPYPDIFICLFKK